MGNEIEKTVIKSLIQASSHASITAQEGAEYFSVSGFGEGYVHAQFKRFLEKFTQGEAEKIFGEGAKQLLIGSMFSESFKTRLAIPAELINNLEPDKKQRFAEFLQPIFDRIEPNKRNKKFIEGMMPPLFSRAAHFSYQADMKDKDSFELEYKLTFYTTMLGKNDPVTRLHKVVNELLGEDLIKSKVEYKRIDYTPYTLIISDAAMDAIHNSPNYDKIVNALKNPEEVCREHRKGDFVGRLRNKAEVGKKGTWSDKFLRKIGADNKDPLEIS